MLLPLTIRRWSRSWAASPGSISLIVLTLALGIGVNALLFSIVRALLLTPIALPDSGGLVAIWEVHRQAQEAFDTTSYPNFSDVRRDAGALSGAAASSQWAPTWIWNEGAERLRGAAVSWDYFAVLGIRPILGRGFQPEEDRPGHDNVVVLSERLWRRRFGADPAVLGRTLTFGTTLVQVVGVVPEFEPPLPGAEAPLEVWAPIGADPATSPRSGRAYRVVGRLRPGSSLEQLRAQLTELNARLNSEHPEDLAGWTFRATTLHERAVAPVRRSLVLLQLVVAAVLAVACVNVSGLLIGRGLRRRRELAIRSALGATRSRIALDVLGESLLLALLGGLLGTTLAVLGVAAVAKAGPALLPRGHLVRVDWAVLGFALGISILAGVIAGLLPAIRTSVDGANPIRPSSGTEHRPGRIRHGLIALEVTGTLVLLVLGALTVQSFRSLLLRDPGVSLDQRRAYPLLLPGAWYSDAQAIAFQERLLGALRSRDVVDAAGTIHVLPFSDDHSCDGYVVAGRPAAEGAPPCAEYRTMSPGYLETVGVRLLTGRLPEKRDRSGAPDVVVINQHLARLAFPGENPVGKRLETHERVREIIGVVADVRHFGLEKESPPQIYVPVGQETRGVFIRQFWLVVRPRGGAAQIDDEVRAIVGALDARVSVGTGRALGAFLDDTLTRPRMRATLLGLFSLLALLIGLTGTAGVASEAVAQRTHEIGVRMALGATGARVIRQFIGECLRSVGLGAVLGSVLAWPLSQLYASRVLGEAAAIPGATLTAAVILLATTSIASWLPARRAAQVQPATALAAEP